MQRRRTDWPIELILINTFLEFSILFTFTIQILFTSTLFSYAITVVNEMERRKPSK